MKVAMDCGIEGKKINLINALLQTLKCVDKFSDIQKNPATDRIFFSPTFVGALNSLRTVELNYHHSYVI